MIESIGRYFQATAGNKEGFRLWTRPKYQVLLTLLYRLTHWHIGKIFACKKPNALLPLSSSLLKFLPEGSLQDLPVFSNSGKQIGIFSGPYSFEKAGELSGRTEQHRLFQYADSKGELHSPPDMLLLDSFAVPWKGAASQPGFRLPADKIILR